MSVNTSDIVGSIPLPAPIAGVLGGYFSHVDTPVDFTVQHDDLEKNHDMATYLSALKASREQKGLFGRLTANDDALKVAVFSLKGILHDR